MKKILIIILFGIIYFPSAGQAPVFDDLLFDADSLTKSYKPKSKHFAYFKAKRGAGGIVTNSKGDSIRSFPISDIVLVFSETKAGSIANREGANKERWENLLIAYPEYFQPGTTLINMCQCNVNGDTASFRKAAGFYAYFTGKEEPVAEVPKVEPKKVTSTGSVTDTKETKSEKVKDVHKEEKVVKEKKEKPVKEDASTGSASESKKAEKKEEQVHVAQPPVKEVQPKKEGYTTPKRSKDPKACRPPCYENGDEDFNNFLKDNINLSKKQKHHSGDLLAVLRLQLNLDGSVKKSFIQGLDEVFNKQIEAMVSNMNLWNPAVRGGVTIKSEIKMTLKYDKSSHSIKPFDINIIPRPGPACKCVSDAAMFGE